jgi:ankyrin repeat protein
LPAGELGVRLIKIMTKKHSQELMRGLLQDNGGKNQMKTPQQIRASFGKLFVVTISALVFSALLVEVRAGQYNLTSEQQELHERLTKEERALIYASVNCLPEKARHALAAGARPDVSLAPPPDTALAYAVNNGCLKVVKLLLEYGADPNGSPGGPHEGKSYLHVATWPGKESTPQIVELLLKEGADPNAVYCRTGRSGPATPLDQARLLKHAVNKEVSDATVAVLTKYGAKSARDGEVADSCTQSTQRKDVPTNK